MKRTIWIAAFLAVTLAAVGMELWAALDQSGNTVSWTELISQYVPEAIATFAIAALIAWLPGHFAHAYKTTGGGRMSPYAKSLVAAVDAALIAGLQAAHDALPMSPTARAWVTVGLAVAGAVAVWAVPNRPATKQ